MVQKNHLLYYRIKKYFYLISWLKLGTTAQTNKGCATSNSYWDLSSGSSAGNYKNGSYSGSSSGGSIGTSAGANKRWSNSNSYDFGPYRRWHRSSNTGQVFTNNFQFSKSAADSEKSSFTLDKLEQASPNSNEFDSSGFVNYGNSVSESKSSFKRRAYTLYASESFTEN